MTVQIDRQGCTGCGLCAIDCEAKALTIGMTEHETYQIFFHPDLCNGCARCEKSCPERCLRLGEPAAETGEKRKLLFEDVLSHCRECGRSLFPKAMIDHLRTKIPDAGKSGYFDICPSCRTKLQIAKALAPNSFDQ
jgi:NAD-dependent dihydropyrimidine dehydrogenase PreA subunit